MSTHRTPQPHQPPAWPYPRWVAHRGGGSLAPENTLAAFRVGQAHGYRMFECDAKLSAEGLPFLLHDDTLARTCQRPDSGSDLAWQALSQLDAGAWFSRQFVGEPPASLQAVVRFCLANHLALNIEIKPTPGDERRTGQVVARQAAEWWAGHPPVHGGPSAKQETAPDNAIGAGLRTEPVPVLPLLSSFQPEALAGAQSSAPGLPRGLLLDSFWPDWLGVAQGLGCKAVIANQHIWLPETLAACRAQGLWTAAYTVNEPEIAERLLGWGIDALITDRIDRFAPD